MNANYQSSVTKTTVFSSVTRYTHTVSAFSTDIRVESHENHDILFTKCFLRPKSLKNGSGCEYEYRFEILIYDVRNTTQRLFLFDSKILKNNNITPFSHGVETVI